jgi:homoserine kinase
MCVCARQATLGSLSLLRADRSLPPLRFICENGIPLGAGLGSSSAAIVSGVLAGMLLTGSEISDTALGALLQTASQLEGHVDNLAPCVYGGVRIGFHADGQWRTSPVSVPPSLACVVFVPTVASIGGVDGRCGHSRMFACVFTCMAARARLVDAPVSL